jgi:hypothetical protein
MNTVMLRRNGGLLRDFSTPYDTGNVENLPGDPSYSPTDLVTQRPVENHTRPIDAVQPEGPERSPGGWYAPINVNPAQYIDQNVGGKSGDTKVLGWSKGIAPFTQYRQPFTGTVLTPPRPKVLNVGEVGRLGQRDKLAARVRASVTTYQANQQQVANAMINPQLGF